MTSLPGICQLRYTAGDSQEEGFFYKELNRLQAEAVLTTQSEGAYLVRPSKEVTVSHPQLPNLALSVREATKIKHLLIKVAQGPDLDFT